MMYDICMITQHQQEDQLESSVLTMVRYVKEWGGSHSWPGVLQLTPPNSPSTPALDGVGLGASAHMIYEARNNMCPRDRLGHVNGQHATVQHVAVLAHLTWPITQAEFNLTSVHTWL